MNAYEYDGTVISWSESWNVLFSDAKSFTEWK